MNELTLNNAKRHLNDGEIQQALEGFLTCSHQFEEGPASKLGDAHFGIAACAMKEGDLKKALESLDRAWLAYGLASDKFGRIEVLRQKFYCHFSMLNFDKAFLVMNLLKKFDEREMHSPVSEYLVDVQLSEELFNGLLDEPIELDAEIGTEEFKLLFTFLGVEHLETQQVFETCIPGYTWPSI